MSINLIDIIGIKSIDAGMTFIADKKPSGTGEPRPVDKNAHNLISLDGSAQTSLSVRARAFVFSDHRSREILALIQRTAPSDATVLIQGKPAPARSWSRAMSTI
jgi:hypothetical protein